MQVKYFPITHQIILFVLCVLRRYCVAVLTESVDPAAYWRKLKQRLKAEGNETVTNCHGLKKEIGQPVVSSINAKQIAQSDTPARRRLHTR